MDGRISRFLLHRWGATLNPANFRQPPLNSAGAEFGGIWRNLAEFGGIWRNLAEFGGIRRNLTEIGGIRRKLRNWRS